MTSPTPVQIRRDSDLQYLREFINERGSECILNLYSVDGFGKTKFLQLVQAEYEDSLPFSLVYAKDYKKKAPYELDRMIQQIISDLRLALPSPADEPAPGRSGERGAALVEQLIDLAARARREGRTILIVIDDYDAIPTGIRAVFESAVLSRLTDQSQVIRMILSSEQELSFRDRLDLRIRIRHHALPPLSTQDIAHSIPQQYQTLAAEISNWAGGLPDMVAYLLQRARDKNIVSLEEYGHRRSELLGEEYRRRLQQVVFEDTEPPPNEAFDILSLLRRFDVSVLRYILPQMEPAIFADFKQLDYLDLIRDLGNRVTWRDQSGYAIEDNLRSVVANYVRTFQPELFARVNQLAIVMYESWLRQGYRQIYLIELLYHSMRLQGHERQVPAGALTNVSRVALEYVGGQRAYGPETSAQYLALQAALQADPDLAPQIGGEVHAAIQERILLAS